MNYSYWLSNIPGIGIRSRNRLIAAAGTAQEVYGMTEKQILAVGGITRKQAGRIAESRNWDYETPFEKMMERGILFVSREDAAFPEKLRNIPDAPYSLYYKGSLPGKKKTAAIVGARMCSPYGHTVAHKIGRIFAESGTAVVSGMADGIDADGHWGALAGGGETYAVLGCGVDVCYPAANRELAQQIACHGGILSEYPPGTRPAAPLFPARNRIISGLSDLIVVVEAKKEADL